MSKQKGQPTKKSRAVKLTSEQINSIFMTTTVTRKKDFVNILSLFLVMKLVNKTNVIEVDTFGKIEFCDDFIKFIPNNYWGKIIKQGFTEDDIISLVENIL